MTILRLAWPPCHRPVQCQLRAADRDMHDLAKMLASVDLQDDGMGIAALPADLLFIKLPWRFRIANMIWNVGVPITAGLVATVG